MADFGSIAWEPTRYAHSNWSQDRIFAEWMAREVRVATGPYWGESTS
ncbi:MAG TPA: hypothetical protein VMT46_06340 [Anaerolineaceae bacterium]|nr:hypothetical protein [Anaerolineaceae bacterium]